MSKRKPNSRHPAREAVRRKVKERFAQPDATEQRVQEINRRMRRAIQEAPDGDGLVTGPLMIAAEHLAEQLVPEDERHLVSLYLVGAWGEVAHAFPETPEIPGYDEWREHSRARIAAAT